jgi:hypothetical protein
VPESFVVKGKAFNVLEGLGVCKWKNVNVEAIFLEATLPICSSSNSFFNEIEV